MKRYPLTAIAVTICAISITFLLQNRETKWTSKNADEIVKGPYNPQQFSEIKKRLNLPAFSKQFK